MHRASAGSLQASCWVAVLLDILTRVGPETVERFAYAWYGPPRAVASAAEEPGDVPEPLLRFYGVAGRWPNLVVQNALVRPPRGEGDRVVFYVENQGLCSWMTIRSRQDDARVWAEVEGEAVVEEEPLSRFLVTVAILEAVFGSPDGASASWLHRDRLSADLGPLRRLPFAPWRGFPEGATFYASDDLLAVSCLNPTPESDEYLSVWVGAHDQSALSPLDPVIDESWEYDSRRER
jgi:hypothetical protein